MIMKMNSMRPAENAALVAEITNAINIWFVTLEGKKKGNFMTWAYMTLLKWMSKKQEVDRN